MKAVSIWPTAVLCSCRDVIHDLDHDAGGCNICGRPDFALGAFCDRTMILCDQCECEFHVGCLRKSGRCDLSQLPTGDSSICIALQPPSAADAVLAVCYRKHLSRKIGLACQLLAVKPCQRLDVTATPLREGMATQ